VRVVIMCVCVCVLFFNSFTSLVRFYITVYFYYTEKNYYLDDFF
jgi:hypothetical protein